MIVKIQNILSGFIDNIYPPFSKILPKQLFCYVFSGGFTTAIDIVLFYLIYYYVLHQSNLVLGFYTFKPHVAAQLLSVIITFPIGFYLQKYLTFTNSNLKGNVQLFRYLIIVACCIFLNIFFIKFFVEHFGIDPTISKIITTILVVSFSYFTQRNFSFKERKN